jgi:hypothetical protein
MCLLARLMETSKFHFTLLKSVCRRCCNSPAHAEVSSANSAGDRRLIQGLEISVNFGI